MESDSHPKDHDMPGVLFPKLPIVTSGSPIFPALPIVTADSPRLSQREKYGSLFYLGLLGLAVAIGLVAWFAYGAWEMRSVWSNIYALHDEARPANDRVRAAISLSRDPRVNQRQRWDICLRTPLPSLARYVVAESLTAEAATADPRGYALSVARSPNWPGWLRLLLTRPMAYAAVAGVKFPRVALEELRANPDPGVALWASFVVAQEDPEDRAGLPELEAACRRTGWERDLASLLREAARERGHTAEQERLLDRATAWLRANHPEGKEFWAPVTAEEKEMRIAPKPAPKLQRSSAEPNGAFAPLSSPQFVRQLGAAPMSRSSHHWKVCAVASALVVAIHAPGLAQERKGEPAAKSKPAVDRAERASGVIVKVEPIAKDDAGRSDKSRLVRLTINTDAVWRDWARDQVSANATQSPKKAAEKGAKSVATKGEPQTENSLVVIALTPASKVETRFRTLTDETTKGAKTASDARSDEPGHPKSNGPKSAHFAAADLRAGLFVEVDFHRRDGAQQASTVTVIRPVSEPGVPTGPGKP